MSSGRLPEDPERLARYMGEHKPPCPRCGYSLEGLVSRVCPECGQELSVSAFLRARRMRTTMPGWLHIWTQAAGVSVFMLLFSVFIVAIGLLAAAALLVLVSYLIVFLGWYWWSRRR